MDLAAELARWVVGLLFVFTGLRKIVTIRRFRESLAQYELVPERWLAPVALLVPVLEIAGGVLETTALVRFYGSALLVLLLVAFSAGMTVNLIRGNNVPCGCAGGRDELPVAWHLVARNIALIGTVVWTAVEPPDAQVSARVAAALTAALALAGVQMIAAGVRLRSRSGDIGMLFVTGDRP